MVQTSLVRKGKLAQPPTFTSIEAERRDRQERLAAALRVFARFGFAQGLAGHITARDPELTDHFWVNPFGTHFSRIRVSDLILVNSKGDIVQGEGPLNQAAFAIHSQIHEARPDVIAAAHAHSFYGKTWSTLGRSLDPITQDSAVFYQDHALFDDFTGIVLETSEGKRIAQALDQNKAVILRNHGLLTVGHSVDEAAWWFIRLEDAAHSQLLAEAAGKPILIDHDIALGIQQRGGTHEAGWRGFQYLWDDITRDQPDLFD
ncbi:class II aldolase/adducin family protein [Calothrix sp. PCC 7507]|uniref:class II aldolase/adducin family protein n=1 Tax=Calothrix sp. PCC 7507 TaxID=99598 RepID=UPI00029F12E6|nr:class II aldolase/adducin family protein [Calothrix sp. PCC 7507]AFY31739.1 class II aldolase/adducin family protein [Calothrix sp. PCC 7507]